MMGRFRRAIAGARHAVPFLLLGVVFPADRATAQASADSLARAWTCPMHPAVTQATPGTCPLCQMDLVETTVERVWYCPQHPDAIAKSPGACSLCGARLVERQIVTPHGDHDPKHGGIFFMAPDTWHHLEGTLPAPGLFRLYLYDNYTRPLSVDGVTARVVFQDFRDENGRETRPPIHTPLASSADGYSLEVADRRLQVSREFYMLVRFTPGRPEDRFDFAFETLSTERSDTIATAGQNAPGSVSPSRLIIPARPEDIIAELDARVERIAHLIRKSALNEVFIPALEAKDLALALDAAPGPLDPSRHRALSLAVKTVVRAAWLLDTYGDFGNKPQVEATYRDLMAGVERVKEMIGVRGRGSGVRENR